MAKCLNMFILLLLPYFMTFAHCAWQQTFSDEFDGAAGSAPSNKWVYDIGGQGWGNNELEYYTNSRQNSALNGKGFLEIIARNAGSNSNLKCWYGPCKYTSARLKTEGKFSQTYGRFEARLKVPQGQGLWPSFWMLGNNIGTVSWPQCGEIDIMEIRGSNTNVNQGTIHGPGYSGAGGISGKYSLSNNAKFSDGYHVFAVEWNQNSITWFVDNKAYETRTPKDLPAGTKWVFDHPFFVILNLAVGGTYDGNPTKDFTQSQIYSIDYVRVFKWV